MSKKRWEATPQGEDPGGAHKIKRAGKKKKNCKAQTQQTTKLPVNKVRGKTKQRELGKAAARKGNVLSLILKKTGHGPPGGGGTAVKGETGPRLPIRGLLVPVHRGPRAGKLN